LIGVFLPTVGDAFSVATVGDAFFLTTDGEAFSVTEIFLATVGDCFSVLAESKFGLDDLDDLERERDGAGLVLTGRASKKASEFGSTGNESEEVPQL
jgi:hypothetical protein